jgi:hypothetical protein
MQPVSVLPGVIPVMLNIAPLASLSVMATDPAVVVLAALAAPVLVKAENVAPAGRMTASASTTALATRRRRRATANLLRLLRMPIIRVSGLRWIRARPDRRSGGRPEVL